MRQHKQHKWNNNETMTSKIINIETDTDDNTRTGQMGAMRHEQEQRKEKLDFTWTNPSTIKHNKVNGGRERGTQNKVNMTRQT